MTGRRWGRGIGATALLLLVASGNCAGEGEGRPAADGPDAAADRRDAGAPAERPAPDAPPDRAADLAPPDAVARLDGAPPPQDGGSLVAPGEPAVVACGPLRCRVGVTVCCFDGAERASCSTNGSCPGSSVRESLLECDGTSDCRAGEICCFEGGTSTNGRSLCVASCPARASDTRVTVQLCTPGAAGDCRAGACQPFTYDGRLPAGYHACR